MVAPLKMRLYLIIGLIVMVLGASIPTILAYFQAQEIRGIIVQTGDYEVEVFASFNSVVVDYNSPYYDRENGSLIVNAYDETSENYIEDLKISVAVKASK